MAKIFSLLFLFVIQMALSAINKNYDFQYLTVNDGLSHADANTIKQDKKGFIWIGTYSGLDRFDGTLIKSYYNNRDDINSPLFNRIVDIDIDDNGKIWQATNYGIHCFDPVKNLFYHYKTKDMTVNKMINSGEIKKIICQQNYIYVLDGLWNFYQFEIDENKKQLVQLNSHLNGLRGTFFFRDANKNVWIASTGKLICISEGITIREYDLHEINGDIEALYVDNIDGKKIIIGYNGEIYSYQKAKDILIYKDKISLANKESISDIKQDYRGLFWVATRHGLYQLDIHSKTFDYIHSANSQNFGLKSDYINQIEIDRAGTLFVATYAGGVNYQDLHPSVLLKVYQSRDNKFSFNGLTIRSIIQEEGSLFIGTHTNGIIQLDKDSREVIKYLNQATNMLSDDNIRDMLIDSNKNIWVAHAKGIEIIPPQKKRSIAKLNKRHNLPKTPIELIEQDVFGQVWAFGEEGIVLIRKDENDIYRTELLKEKYPDDPLFRRKDIVVLYSDHKRPEILISTRESLYRIMLDSEGNIEKSLPYYHIPNSPYSLKANFICSVYRQSDSILWVGHIGNALSRISLYQGGAYKAQNFPIQINEKLKDFEEIQPDKDGNIWIAGNELAKFDTETHTYKVYSSERNRYLNSYKIGASYKGSNGSIYFGGNNGFVVIPPETVATNPFSATPEITDILIHNAPLSSSQQTRIGNITYKDEIELKHNENSITFCFSPMHYAFTPNCKYKYRLLGVDQNYHQTSNTFIPINYTNLSPGKYTLELMASNNDEVWNNDTIRKLTINILPPWWLSKPLKIIYFLFILFLLYMVYWYFISLNTIKHEIKLQELKESQKEEMHQMQLQFFTNISHEFRTPLTLILGATEQIISETTSIKGKQLLSYLNNNVSRLLTLINELMDFRKSETGSFKLRVHRFDCAQFIGSLADEFSNVANTNGINYVIKTPTSPLIVWADSKIIEKVIINLLNNAFKYCNQEGIVEVEVSDKIQEHLFGYKSKFLIDSKFEGEEYFHIRISDTGIGISNESIHKVFDRYYQIEDSHNDPHLGSGVGLSLVKNLMLIHKGKLTIYSERNRGTEFIISFPCHQNDYTNQEKKHLSKPIGIHLQTTKHLEKLPSIPLSRSVDAFQKKPILLLVEDNQDVQSFLTEILSDYYSIIKANDGIEALEQIKECIPDLILSDLMMPRMDGNELCSAIKKDNQTRNIPFILLTGKDAHNTHNTSVMCGVDAFLNKPISIDLLLNTLKSQYERNFNIQANISENYIYNAFKVHVSTNKKKLGDRIIQIIVNNITNTNLDVKFISEYLGISRTNLYEKAKEIFDMPIIELVREIRLRKAIQIMSEENVSMADIATRAGFKNQSYFSISFKKKYGVTPTQYMKNLKKSVE